MPSRATKKKDNNIQKTRNKRKFKKILGVKNNKKLLEITAFSGLNALTKLRIGVILIFIFSTISIILVTTSIFITVILILLSYLLIIILMIKLLIIKKL